MPCASAAGQQLFHLQQLFLLAFQHFVHRHARPHADNAGNIRIGHVFAQHIVGMLFRFSLFYFGELLLQLRDFTVLELGHLIQVLFLGSAREVAPDLPEIDFGQPLSDSVLKELCGKASLVGFGNDLTGVVVVQVNSGSGNQVSTASVFSTQTTLKGPGTNIISLDANTAKQFRTIIGFFKR